MKQEPYYWDNEKIALILEKVQKMTPPARVEFFNDATYFPVWFVYHFPEYITYPFADFHQVIFKDLADLCDNNGIDELTLIAFRESAKTSIAKAYMTYLILHKKTRYMNIDCYNKGNSENTIFDIANNLLLNTTIRNDYGDIYTKSAEDAGKTIKRLEKFVTTTGILVSAHTTQESVRGRLIKNMRPDFLCLDDFETSETRDSEAKTLTVKEHIDEAMTGMTQDGSARILYLGNYLTEAGSVQHLMNRALTYKRLKVHNIPIQTDEGKILWESKYNQDKLDNLKEKVGIVVYNREYLNKPYSSETAVFKTEYFKTFDASNLHYLNTRVFCAIDTKASHTAEAGKDYYGITVAWVDHLNNWYLIAKRYKISSKDFVDLLFRLSVAHNIETFGIEKIRFTEGLRIYIDQEMQTRNRYLDIQYITTKGVQKEIRTEQALQPRYSKGKIFHLVKNGQNLAADLEQELIRYPTAINNDVSDSASYLAEICTPPQNNVLQSDYGTPTSFGFVG